MNIIKPLSRRILIWSLLTMVMLAVFINTAGFFGVRFLSDTVSMSVLQDAAIHSSQLKAGLDKLLPVVETANKFYIPVVSFVFLIFAFLLWIIIRSSVARFVRKSDIGIQQQSSKKKESKKDLLKEIDAEPVITKKELIETNKRFYLQLLSVLQREGRLIDFFSEDLSMYEDAQIGAAVRSIQDNCKNSLKKYLNPKPVIDQNEGDTVTIPAGFDPNTIKLTGNVSGEPPFQGTLRHKGWRASRLELPTLSAVKDPGILSPAEVEIL